MKLTAYLREQGYDLIEGPVRNHKTMQLWIKKPFNEIQLYYMNIDHAFESEVKFNEVTDPALSINSSKKDDYAFNIGITYLEEILKSIGLGNFEISSKIKSGKKVTISYNNSFTKVIPLGEVTNYLSTADFRHPNPVLLRNANRNNILVITGIIYAQNLVADINTDFDLDTNLVAQLNKAADGKLNFKIAQMQNLKMISSGSNHFPIAVKANRIDFDKGVFKGLKLVTDNRNFF
ncbi:MAG: hypothetical protein ACLFQS_08710 [Bacteroidales bacterium]